MGGANIHSIAILFFFVKCSSVPGNGWPHGDGTRGFSLLGSFRRENRETESGLAAPGQDGSFKPEAEGLERGQDFPEFKR